MDSGRLEAFSDGVLAIIITIMVLEIKAPEETDFAALFPQIPIFISYIVSFIYIGTYWNNHHHLFQITERVDGKVLWANLHLLFWLSLIPFASSWIGENHIESGPVAFYGFILLMSALAYTLLERQIIETHGSDFTLRTVKTDDKKAWLSLLFYVLGIGLSLFKPGFGIVCYVIPVILWFIPDRRIENSMKK